MTYKKYTKLLLILTFMAMFILASFTFFMDPYWAFSHSHKFNNMQKGSNEREQKSNLVYYRDFDYDTLILGSSRTTLINQNHFKGFQAFNYALSLVKPYEYNPYIEFAKLQNKKDFKTIIIGLDFYGTGQDSNQRKPEDVFSKTKSFAYRYTSLLSVDALKVSFNSLIRAITNKTHFRAYDRNNVANVDPMKPEILEHSVHSLSIEKATGMKKYQFNENYKTILENLKLNNPNTKFIVFTTPVTSQYLNLLMRHNMLENYKKWLRINIEVFDEITHFMDFNTITNNYKKYYVDKDHAYPWVGDMIADKILHVQNAKTPKDFGKTLHRENIEQYLKKFETNLSKSIK